MAAATSPGSGWEVTDRRLVKSASARAAVSGSGTKVMTHVFLLSMEAGVAAQLLPVGNLLHA